MAELYLPGHVGTFLGDALESGQDNDRLLALRAANHADRQDPSHRTRYGFEVASVLMDRAGLEFEAASTEVFDRGWSRENGEGAMAMREVVEAAGPEIGVQSTFHEFVGRSLHKMSDIVLVDGERFGKLRLGLDEQQPYFIRYLFHNDKSRQNLLHVLEAVRGDRSNAVMLTDPRTEAISEIRGLDEVYSH